MTIFTRWLRRPPILAVETPKGPWGGPGDDNAGEGGGPVDRHHHVVPVELQGAPQRLAHGLVVVDDEDTRLLGLGGARLAEGHAAMVPASPEPSLSLA